MAKEIVWTTRANSSFRRIVDYLKQEWGDNVTETFVTNAFGIIELISVYPELGTLENPNKNIRGFLLTKHNRIFYRVSKKEIVLLNFFDSRSGPQKKRP